MHRFKVKEEWGKVDYIMNQLDGGRNMIGFPFIELSIYQSFFIVEVMSETDEDDLEFWTPYLVESWDYVTSIISNFTEHRVSLVSYGKDRRRRMVWSTSVISEVYAAEDEFGQFAKIYQTNEGARIVDSVTANSETELSNLKMIYCCKQTEI